MKGAGDYLNSKPTSGKKPTIYATVSLVSLDAMNASVSKTAARTIVWYGLGEMTRVNFPGDPALEGKFPMWVNNGTPKAPFGGGDVMTLGVTIQGNGKATLHYQVDGRNRMGRGPQSITMEAVASGASDSTQIFTTTTDFFGKKQITLSLTKGESDAPATPVVAPKAIGARYKISPSFFITNSDDGPGDNTLEVRTDIKFTQNGKQVGYLARGLDMKKGQRVEGQPFEITVLDAQPESAKIYVKGKAYDYDAATKNDNLWAHDMSFSAPYVATKPVKTGLMTIYPNFIPDDAQGNLDILVQKIADVY